MENNFQPMPKRFIVWSADNQEFITVAHDGSTKVHTLQDIAELLSEPTDDNLIICQSTNHSDDGGVEIFEGAILEFYAEGCSEFGISDTYAYGYVFVDEGELRIQYEDYDQGLEAAFDESSYVHVLGHILNDSLKGVEELEQKARIEAWNNDAEEMLKIWRKDDE